MPEFRIDWTPVAMTLNWEGGGRPQTHLITLIGDDKKDHPKVLYEGDDLKEAQRIFKETKAHFEERLKNRAQEKREEEARLKASR